MTALVAIAAILPCVLIVQFVYDRLEHDASASGLCTSFVLGAISTLAVLAIAPLLAPSFGAEVSPYAQGFSEAFVLAALPEEAVKLLILMVFGVGLRHVRDERTGIAHGLAVSLGFAACEMALYAIWSGFGAAILRSVTTVPMHALLGTVMGYLAGRATSRWARRPARDVTLAFALPVLLHGAYDFPLMVLSDARIDAWQPSPLAVIGLSGLVTVVLLVGSLSALHLYRGAFPRPAQPLRRRVAVGRVLRTGAVAWSLIPFGGLLASAGGWIVGSLLFSRAPGLDSVPNAARAIAAFYALGAALICLGLFFGFRGIRLKGGLAERSDRLW